LHQHEREEEEDSSVYYSIKDFIGASAITRRKNYKENPTTSH
jgi:hypothetical protein